MAGDVKAMGDLDGDGFVDLVLGGMAGREDMVWYRYPDWARHSISAAGKEFTTDMQLVDVDGDGDLDIVVADGDGPGNVQWLENPRPKQKASAKPWLRHSIGSHGTWVHDIEVGDFDRDGRPDVVTRKDSTKIWFAQADGAWTERDLSGLVGGGEGLGVGDIDADGDRDLVANCAWFENPGDARAGTWRRHSFCKPWDDALTAAVADFDKDGAMDVVVTSQHKPLKLAIFSHAGRPLEENWRERLVDAAGGGHKINVGDFDLDGRLDVQTALEKQSVTVYLNQAGQGFRKLRLPETGHNVRAADVGQDGDLDLFGAEYTGNPPVRLWENTRSGQRVTGGTAPPKRWTVQRITNRHERTFGLDFVDVDRDGRVDIVSGTWWYRNDGRAAESWPQHPLPARMHACIALDVDGDRDADVIAQKDEGQIGVYWLERHGEGAGSWVSRRVGELPRASHDIGTQGYASADLEKGGRPEVVMTSGGGAYYFVLPEKGEPTPWRRVLISPDSSDEGVAATDIDRDGRVDVVTTTADKRVLVHLNPGRSEERWQTRGVGSLPGAVYLDRVAVADFNRDGRMDLVVTEENGRDSGATTFWFEQPLAGHVGEWPRHLVVSQASTNSLGVGDLDGDGDQDMVTGEHRGAHQLSVWDNDGAGNFSQQILSAGLESHLGARPVDLDGDKDLDVVSIAWDSSETIFVLWNEQGTK